MTKIIVFETYELVLALAHAMMVDDNSLRERSFMCSLVALDAAVRQAI
jgi:hypothetical protein